MEFLENFSSNFLDVIINRYSAVKNGDGVTEDDIDDLEDIEKRADLLNVLNSFREKLYEKISEVDADFESIEELVKEGAPIDRYLNTSMENEVQSEFDDTLYEDDGEPETRAELDQENLNSGSYTYSVIQDEYKRDIIELDDLITKLTK